MIIAVTTTAFLSPRSPLISPNITSFLKNPTLKPSFVHLHLQPPLLPPPLMASSIIAEYAKSKRSTCKTCSNTIAANALRLGVVTKDPKRGFDMTKWHHFLCFSFDSSSVSSIKSVEGFDSLKSDDQEAMKKLMEEHGKVKDIDADATAGDNEISTKKRKVKDIDADATAGDGENHEISAEKRKHEDGRDVLDVEEKQETARKLRLAVDEGAKVEIALATSDIKDIYKGATLLPKWKAFHTIIFLEKDDGLQDSSKIAAFDFDGCLAKTSVMRTGADAWSLMYPSIPDKLQKLYNDGYKLVIFTNESNIDRWKNKRQKAVDSKIGRLNNFIKRVEVPIQVFIACGFDSSGSEDPYRKPKTGMWHVMEKHFNSGIAADMEQSFYVGDAAGRENDHSNADIKFAQDIGLKFYLPEEFFAV